jgi:hypothetical protein
VDGECLKLYGRLYNYVLITCFCCFVLQKMARQDGQVAPEFADAEEGDVGFLCHKVSFSMFILVS